MTDLVNALHDIADSLDNIGTGDKGSFSPDITDPQDGQTLVFDATAGKWINGAGGGGLVVTLTDNGTQLIGDKTWQECYDAFAAGNPVVVSYSEVSDDTDLCLASNIMKYAEVEPGDSQCFIHLDKNHPALYSLTPNDYVGIAY